MISVKTLKTADEIRAHASLWNWPGTRDSDLDYFLYFAGVRAGLLRPQVFVAYRGTSPEAMLIGKLERRQVSVRLGHLNLPTPRLRVLSIVYGGLRGSTGGDTTEALVKEALKTVRCGDADVAVFEPVGVDTQLYCALASVPDRLERGFCCARQSQYRMQLPRSSRELQQRIPAKRRHDYMRKGRQLGRDFSGDVSFQWYRQASPGVYRDLEFIAERSHQRQLGVGFQDTPELRGWWELAGSKGWLRVGILYAGGEPCAFHTGVAYGGILWGDFMAYNQQFASYSPGMYSALLGFGELCDSFREHDIREVNLGPGDSDLKLLLSSSSIVESSVRIYPSTLWGIGLNLILSLVILVDGSARKHLGRRGLLMKAAKRLRQWLRRDQASRSPGRHFKDYGMPRSSSEVREVD